MDPVNKTELQFNINLFYSTVYLNQQQLQFRDVGLSSGCFVVWVNIRQFLLSENYKNYWQQHLKPP